MRGDKDFRRTEDERAYRQRRESNKNRNIPVTGRDPGPRREAPRREAYRYKKKKRHKWPIVLLVILFILLAAAVGLFIFTGRIQTQKLGSLLVNEGVGSHRSVDTIVLYGVDSREGALTKDCHSDTIMICTLDHKAKQIKLASVYRDTYLDNTNGEYRKATECYFYGGPERSVNMLNKNLDLDIGNYIAINFNVMVEVADLLGGIDIEITEEEMGYINGYCVETSQVTGVGYTPLDTYGPVHLDGVQTMAYCRIRYTEGWDFKRTERQRTVLAALSQKAKSADPIKLFEIVNTMIPQIATSYGTTQLISILTKVLSYDIAGETGFPFRNVPADVNGSDVVVPQDLASNVSELHEFLYGETGYVPSATVAEISSTITQTTGI